jgi:hypothetical protein
MLCVSNQLLISQIIWLFERLKTLFKEIVRSAIRSKEHPAIIFFIASFCKVVANHACPYLAAGSASSILLEFKIGRTFSPLLAIIYSKKILFVPFLHPCMFLLQLAQKVYLYVLSFD